MVFGGKETIRLRRVTPTTSFGLLWTKLAPRSSASSLTTTPPPWAPTSDRGVWRNIAPTPSARIPASDVSPHLLRPHLRLVDISQIPRSAGLLVLLYRSRKPRDLPVCWFCFVFLANPAICWLVLLMYLSRKPSDLSVCWFCFIFFANPAICRFVCSVVSSRKPRDLSVFVLYCFHFRRILATCCLVRGFVSEPFALSLVVLWLVSQRGNVAARVLRVVALALFTLALLSPSKLVTRIPQVSAVAGVRSLPKTVPRWFVIFCFYFAFQRCNAVVDSRILSKRVPQVPSVASMRWFE